MKTVPMLTLEDARVIMVFPRGLPIFLDYQIVGGVG